MNPVINTQSISFLREKIERIENAAIAGASAEELSKLISPLTRGYLTSTTYLNGPFFRGRKATSVASIKTLKDLWSPPPSLTPQNRVNEFRAPVFYCSATDHIATRELNLMPGDRIVVLKCLLKNTEKRPHVLSIGNFKNVIRTGKSVSGNKAEGAFDFRKLPSEIKNNALLIDSFFARVFTEKEKTYFNLTNAISKFYLSSSEVDGLVYPSVKSNGGLNLALKVEAADKLLEPDIIYSSFLEKELNGGRLFMRRDFLATVRADKSLSWYQAVTFNAPSM